jgi:hypothetical protein
MEHAGFYEEELNQQNHDVINDELIASITVELKKYLPIMTKNNFLKVFEKFFYDSTRKPIDNEKLRDLTLALSKENDIVLYEELKKVLKKKGLERIRKRKTRKLQDFHRTFKKRLPRGTVNYAPELRLIEYYAVLKFRDGLSDEELQRLKKAALNMPEEAYLLDMSVARILSVNCTLPEREIIHKFLSRHTDILKARTGLVEKLQKIVEKIKSLIETKHSLEEDVIKFFAAFSNPSTNPLELSILAAVLYSRDDLYECIDRMLFKAFFIPHYPGYLAIIESLNQKVHSSSPDETGPEESNNQQATKEPESEGDSKVIQPKDPKTDQQTNDTLS